MEAGYALQVGNNKVRKEATGNTNFHKTTKCASIVEALECTLPRNHEDHIAEMGFNSMNH